MKIKIKETNSTAYTPEPEMICNNCSDCTDYCDNCGNNFDEEDEIFCDEVDSKHYCGQCVDNGDVYVIKNKIKKSGNRYKKKYI